MSFQMKRNFNQMIASIFIKVVKIFLVSSLFLVYLVALPLLQMMTACLRVVQQAGNTACLEGLIAAVYAN